MSTGRTLTVIAAVAIVLVGLLYGLDVVGGDSDSAGNESTDTTVAEAPDDAVVVTFAYSPEKEQLIEPLEAEFNGSGAEVDGRPVFLDATPVSSGAATDGIADDTLQPVLWSPASSLWGRLLNFRADDDLVADDNPSLVRSPLVIAMPRPMAEALGWPKTELGWADILDLARSDEGWARHGHPEWGAFKFGQTNPDFSTSGLSATAAEYLVAAGKKEGLTLADVEDPAVRGFVRDIQSSVVHYGDTTLFFADQIAERGIGYVSAVAMEEVTVLDYNLRLRDEADPELVAIYPKEGTFFSDNPLIVLQGDWVDEAERSGAEQVIAFFEDKVTPKLAAAGFFRPPTRDAKPVSPIVPANGVDPGEPTSVLSLPEPRVLNEIVKAWRADRKPARVEVVLDVSGSMNEEDKLEAAKEGLVGFLKLLQPQDEVALSVFSDAVIEVSRPVRIRGNRNQLISRVEGLFADGNTSLYDATDAASERIANAASDERINAVVVLSDGQDNASSYSIDQLLARLTQRSGEEGDSVRIFTIAYGDSAADDVLAEIAEAGGGISYSGDPENIEDVYIQISSFF